MLEIVGNHILGSLSSVASDIIPLNTFDTEPNRGPPTVATPKIYSCIWLMTFSIQETLQPTYMSALVEQLKGETLPCGLLPCTEAVTFSPSLWVMGSLSCSKL